MSQFILCKSTNNLTSLRCVRVPLCEEPPCFVNKVAVKLFGDNQDGIWTVTDIDSLFIKAQNKPFEDTELYFLLSDLFDACEVLILWYSEYYQDLDKVSTKEQFLHDVEEGVNSGMCESYLYVECLNHR